MMNILQDNRIIKNEAKEREREDGDRGEEGNVI